MISENGYRWLGLIVSLVCPILISVALANVSLTANAELNALLKEGFFWLLLLLLLAIAKYGEHAPVNEYGTKQKAGRTLGLGVLVLLSLFGTIIVFGILRVVITQFQKPPMEPLMMKVIKYPLYLKALICIRAGVTEETFFRAYGISRMQQLTGKRWVAIAIPLIFFSLGHAVYGTIDHVIGACFLGITLTIFYVKVKNLYANMIGHAVYDFLMLLLASVAFHH